MSRQAMQKRVGTKLVNLLPMTRAEYNAFRGWDLPADEDGSDEGYLVECLDGGKSNTPHYAGYVSWSPKAQADATYRPASAMTFGDALIMLKAGERVARAGWNGKGMWLAYTPGSEFAPEHAKPGHAAAFRAKEAPHEDVRLLPHIDMRAADGSMVIGWLASQTDMLAEDWQVV